MTLGVNVNLVRKITVVISAVMTGIAVSVAGSIGFVLVFWERIDFRDSIYYHNKWKKAGKTVGSTFTVKRTGGIKWIWDHMNTL